MDEQNYSNVVHPEELEYFIQSLRKFELEEVGNDNWLDCHEKLIKLSQQAIIEASAYREEAVKELFVLHAKLKILVHEAYCVLVWKTKILPILLEMNPNPQASFLIYNVFFHEGSAISLLESVLFHQNGCEALADASLDLIDYCAQAITQLIGLVSMGHHENFSNTDVDESSISEIERHKRDLLYKIGLRCLSILNYLVDKVDLLPLSARKRLVTIHDVPCLLVEILHFKPWLRRTEKGFEKFIDEVWKSVQGEDIIKVTKYEAQTWFCFRQILFNQELMASYNLTSNRKNEISKCLGLLHDAILDQLPPLIELKKLISSLPVSSNKTNSKNINFLLEEVPEIKEDILKKAEKAGGFKKIATKQSKIFLTDDTEKIFSLAKRMTAAYNTDVLEVFESKSKISNNDQTMDSSSKTCGNCKSTAEKKCSNCKSVYYCNRECQLEHWSTHKNFCIEFTSTETNK